MPPIPLGAPHVLDLVDPPCLHEMEGAAPIRHRIECQLAAHPQAITYGHVRRVRWEQDRNLARLAYIDHQDYTDDRALPVSDDLANVAHQDDLVMMSWDAHWAPSPPNLGTRGSPASVEPLSRRESQVRMVRSGAGVALWIKLLRGGLYSTALHVIGPHSPPARRIIPLNRSYFLRHWLLMLVEAKWKKDVNMFSSIFSCMTTKGTQVPFLKALH
jgi:hypothetical protein